MEGTEVETTAFLVEVIAFLDSSFRTGELHIRVSRNDEVEYDEFVQPNSEAAFLELVWKQQLQLFSSENVHAGHFSFDSRVA